MSIHAEKQEWAAGAVAAAPPIATPPSALQGAEGGEAGAATGARQGRASR